MKMLPRLRDIYMPDTRKTGMPFCKVQRKAKKIKKAMASNSKRKNRR